MGTTLINSEKNISRAESAKRNCAARLAAITPLVFMAVYLYGWRALILAGVAVLTAMACDILAAVIQRKPWDYQEVSSLLFAVLLVGMMPASVPYHIVVLSTLTAILVGKHIFGGIGNYPFHPSALGYVVAVISWPQQILNFPAPFYKLALGNIVKFTPSETPAQIIKMAGLPNISKIYRLMGIFSGPMAVNASLVVAACALLLLAVRKFHLLPALSYLGSCAAVSWLFPRVSGIDRMDLLTDELLCCGLIFCAVFLVQDEICGARTGFGRLLYGAVAGVATMVFQYYGSYPYGCCFGVLCADAVSVYLDDCAILILQGKRHSTQKALTDPMQKEIV